MPEIYYRNDDTGEERTVKNAFLVPYGMLNGEIRQSDGSFWKFKNGRMYASNPPKRDKDENDAAV